MFGFGVKRKKEDLRKMTNLWMKASLLAIDIEMIKSNPTNYKTTLAFFFGPTDFYGRNYGLNQQDTMAVYIPCMAQNLDIEANKWESIYKTIVEIATDPVYIKIMNKGINALNDWMKTQNHSAPFILGTMLKMK